MGFAANAKRLEICVNVSGGTIATFPGPGNQLSEIYARLDNQGTITVTTGERLHQMLVDNEALYKFWAEMRKQNGLKEL